VKNNYPAISRLSFEYNLITFATDTRSGLISYLSQPNIVPSLPNAQITYNRYARANSCIGSKAKVLIGKVLKNIKKPQQYLICNK